MKTIQRKKDGVYCLVLNEKIKQADAYKVFEEISLTKFSKQGYAVLDVGIEQFFNSEKLAFFSKIKNLIDREYGKKNGNLVLINCSDECLNVMNITKLDRVIPVFSSFEDFKKEFVPPDKVPNEQYSETEKELEITKQGMIDIMSYLEKVNKDLALKEKSIRTLLSQKDEFMGMAAHDIRSPLSTVLTATEILLDGPLGPLNSEQKEFVKSISESAEACLMLLNDILDVEKIESGKLSLKPEMNLLSEIVKHVVASNEISAAKKEIRIVGIYPESEKPVIFDPVRIRQAVMNIINNAVKFTPRGGTVEVLVKHNDNGGALVEITDDGPGVSKDEAPKLFGYFQQLSTKPTAGEHGTGLGLAITKKIIDLHHGETGFRNIEGRGACFWFSIPAGTN